MRQGRLFKRAKSIPATVRDYDKSNLESARLILASPDEHGGPDAFPVTWARAVVARIEKAWWKK